MEIRFVSITAFRTALEALLKVKRKVYAGVPEEISKRGPMQKLDLEGGELPRLMDAFAAESKAHQVVVHDVTNNLKEIKPKEVSQTDR